MDIFASQETCADITVMHDTKKDLSKKQLRPFWKEATQVNRKGGGAMVAATTPLYCTSLIGYTLDTEMEDLNGSTRLAAAWTQTNGVDNGIAVMSYYGIISGSNSDTDKKRMNERHIAALWRYLAHHKEKLILVCMYANFHIDKSEVLQAMKVAGWKDIFSGLGDTFRCGFTETLEDDTVMWTNQGGEIFGETLAPTNTAVQEYQICSIGEIA